MPEGKPGRPKVLIRRHVIEVKKETREWIESLLDVQVNKVLGVSTGRSVIKALGRAASHPVGFIAISASITALLIKLGLAKEEIAAVQEWATGVAASAGETGEKARRLLERAWCRFRTMLARPLIGEAEYERQMAACGSSPPSQVEADIVAAEARERERIQRERAAVPP